MVALTYLAAAAAAVTGVFAAPTPEAGAPDFEIGAHNLARRQGMDYNQNYKTGGNVNFQPSSNGYSVTFSGAGDFVVGKGWRTGQTRYLEHPSSSPTQQNISLPAPTQHSAIAGSGV